MSLTKFTDVTLYWPNLYERNRMSGKFQVDLAQLNDAQVEKLEELGVNVRNKGNEEDNFVTAKSSNYEIKPYDTSGNELKDTVVGNGTKATVLFDTYKWKQPTGKTGVSISIKKLIITDLVEYKAPDLEQEVEDVL